MLFRPTKAYKSILSITPQTLTEMGVKAVILDVDNTLTTHNNPTPIDGIDEWLNAVKSSGIKLIIVSNNHPPRVAPFAERLGLDYVPEGAKPLPKGMREAMKRMGVKRKETCAIGDQIFTDILGANLSGIKSIFVQPIEFETSFWFKVKRTIETPFRPKKFIN
ncbi:MAG: YqeG family HAD IIIA-type phosphatase [Oscillospiraceae bacterium]